jgi:hypothetical protein
MNGRAAGPHTDRSIAKPGQFLNVPRDNDGILINGLMISHCDMS